MCFSSATQYVKKHYKLIYFQWLQTHKILFIFWAYMIAKLWCLEKATIGYISYTFWYEKTVILFQYKTILCKMPKQYTNYTTLIFFSKPFWPWLLRFFSTSFNTVSSAAPHSRLCRSMPGLNPRLLRLWKWSLTTLLDLTGCSAFFPNPIETVLNKVHII
jgi:hypothetical protein